MNPNIHNWMKYCKENQCGVMTKDNSKGWGINARWMQNLARCTKRGFRLAANRCNVLPRQWCFAKEISGNCSCIIYPFPVPWRDSRILNSKYLKSDVIFSRALFQYILDIYRPLLIRRLLQHSSLDRLINRSYSGPVEQVMDGLDTALWQARFKVNFLGISAGCIVYYWR